MASVKDERFVWQRLGLVPSLAVAAAVLALAGVSGSASLSQALARREPAVAAGLWPGSGFAQANLAALIAVDGADAARPVAERALLAEPAAVAAVRSLALHYQSAGDPAQARALMRAAVRLTRRDSASNLWLVDDALRAGELDRAATLVDATLRTDTAAGALLLPRLAVLLSEPEAETFLLALLQRDPPWQHDFWSAVLQAETLPTLAVALRIALHRQGVGLAPGHDARLVAALVERQQFEQAFALHAAARTGNGDDTASFAPVDWQLVSGGQYGVSAGAAGTISVAALGGAQGVLAQKILYLPRGRYALRAASDAAAGGLTLRLTCAQLRGEGTFALALPLGNAEFEQPSSCRYAWLTITMAPDQADRSFTIQPIALRRIGDGA